MNTLFAHHHTLIAPYVIRPDTKEEGAYTQPTSSTVFTSSALSDLKQHVVDRLGRGGVFGRVGKESEEEREIRRKKRKLCLEMI